MLRPSTRPLLMPAFAGRRLGAGRPTADAYAVMRLSDWTELAARRETGRMTAEELERRVDEAHLGVGSPATISRRLGDDLTAPYLRTETRLPTDLDAATVVLPVYAAMSLWVPMWSSSFESVHEP